MTTNITKSRVLSGLRCPKRLWLQTNQPELAEPSSNSALTIANGNEVGAMARLNYPNGILIEHISQPDLAVAETARLIANSPSVPLFEAAFVYAGVLVRADILSPTGTGWRMVEVKSSGSVKDHHLLDCAIQLWVVEGQVSMSCSFVLRMSIPALCTQAMETMARCLLRRMSLSK